MAVIFVVLDTWYWLQDADFSTKAYEY